MSTLRYVASVANSKRCFLKDLKSKIWALEKSNDAIITQVKRLRAREQNNIREYARCTMLLDAIKAGIIVPQYRWVRQ